ncbi:MAG: hypothetical protein K2K00_03155 [Muribaculaceae bacterium]|nr:hypothetical protein [Muribaculaceae bacterium]MDE5594783.1 hypothetical protein [Muribaculaceae bacterium]MDE6702657.1 hypothetical protein [Muribaculaceae bacterium]
MKLKDFRQTLNPIIKKVKDVYHSQRGRNLLVFLIFLFISTVLWCLLSFNEEDQFDVRMPVRLTNVPDSVTVITTPPSVISVSLRTRGTDMLKHSFGKPPTFDIDFRVYRYRNSVLLGSADVKAVARAAYGGANILVAAPDSINLAFTTRRGIPLPIVIDYQVTAGPQSTIAGKPTLSLDSTLIYSTGRIPSGVRSITTEPIRLTDLNRPTTTRVRLIAPRNTRVIPDSVDVTFNVEPLISKSRKVVIEPVNVPKGVKLITFPAQTEVLYMVPMSLYNDSDPHFRVLADYNSIAGSHSHKIKLRLRDVPSELQNVHLSADSAEYIIERR